MICKKARSKNAIKIIPFFAIITLVFALMFQKPVNAVELWYGFTSSTNFNIRGDGYKTTYSDAGYSTVLMVDGTTYEIHNGTGGGGNVTCKTELSLISAGNYVKIAYTVENTGTEDKTIGISTHSDIMIRDDDKATCINLEGNTGFTMSDGTYTFNFVGKNSYGVTDVDGYWFGLYSDRTSNLWNPNHPSSLYSTDSGMTFHWKDKVIHPGEKKTFSAAIGMGKLSAPPTISVTSVLKDYYFSNEILPIVGKVNDIDIGDIVSIYYAFDGEGEQNIGRTFTPNGVATDYSVDIRFPEGITRGEHFIDIWAVDNNGNMSSSVKVTFFVETDYIPPTATYTLSPPGWTNQDVTITVTATDNITGVKKITPPTGSAVNNNVITYKVSANGSYKFILEDNVGNSCEYTVQVSNIDKQNPNATVTLASGGWAQSLSLSVTCTDTGGSDVKSYKYAITDSNTAPQTYSSGDLQRKTDTITINQQGEKYLHIKVRDNAGNETGDLVFGPYKIDRTAPTVSANPNQCTWRQYVDVAITCADTGGSNVKSYKYAVTDSDSAPSSYSGDIAKITDTIRIETEQKKYLHIKVKDNANNESADYVFGPYYIDRTRPTASHTLDKNVWSNQDVTITVTGADALSGVKQVTLPNNTVVQGSVGSYKVQGNGTYKFIITDNAGNTYEYTVTIDKIDKINPTVAVNPTSGGWAKSINVSVTCSDTGGSNFKSYKYAITDSNSAPSSYTSGDITRATDTITINQSGEKYLHIKVRDNAGNESADYSFGPYKIDITPPTASHTLDKNEWTNQDITITVTGADTQSGVKQVTLPNNTVVPGSVGSYKVQGNGTYKFIITDNAGNTYEYTVTIDKIDKISPTVTVNLTSGGWAKSINVAVTCSDTGGSNVKSYKYAITDSNSAPASYGTDIAKIQDTIIINQSGEKYLHIKVRDNAGNESADYSFGPYKIDITPPTATHTINPAIWTNQNVTITVTGADTQSGVKQVTLPDNRVVQGNVGSYTVSGNGTYKFIITDNAGNTYEYTVTIDKIDKVPPTVIVNPVNGGWAQSINVSVNCLDTGGSNFKSYKYAITDSNSTPSSYSTDITKAQDTITINQSGEKYLHIRVLDNAGNESQNFVFGPYKIDITSPTATHTINPAIWTNQDVTITVTGADTQSGVKQVTLPDNRVVQGNVGNYTVQGNGTYKFVITDNARNTYEYTVTIDKIDKIVPKVTVNPTESDWKQYVNVAVNCTDEGGSNVKSYKYVITNDRNAPTTYGTDISKAQDTITINQSGEKYLHIKVLDNAGNESADYVFGPYKIDITPPTATHVLDINRWTNQDVTITVTGADTQSGVKEVILPDDTVVKGNIGNYTVQQNGKYKFIIIDNADNRYEYTVTIENIDKIIPTFVANPEQHDWAQSIEVQIQCSDEGGSGFKNFQYVAINEGEEVKVWNNAIKEATKTIVIDETGEKYLHVIVRDNAGNISEDRILGAYKIDRTAPTATHTLSMNEWKNEDVEITVTATDTQSGVKQIVLPNGTTVKGNIAKYTVQENGNYTFALEDNVGNVYKYTVFVTEIDKIAPEVKVNPNKCEWTQEVEVEIECSDKGGSEFKSYKYAITDNEIEPTEWSTDIEKITDKIIINENGDKYLHIKARDNAGNESPDKVFGIYHIDRTAPTATSVQNINEWINQDIEITITGADAQSGVKYIELPNGERIEGESAKYTVGENGEYKFIIEDNVGNIYEYKTHVTNIDKENPTITVNPENSEWAKKVMVHVECNDEGGSNFKFYKYTITGPDETPTIWSDNYTNAIGDIKIEEDGIKYLHIKVRDNAGNEIKNVYGPYHMDNSVATGIIEHEPTDWVIDELELIWRFEDDKSGIQKIVLPNGEETTEAEGRYKVTENGIYEFTIYDNLGNSTIISKEITNIDKNQPIIILSQEESEWINEDTIIKWECMDTQSGFKEVLLPDGNRVSEESGEFVAKEIGTYTFIAYDNVGNKNEVVIEIQNVDKKPPELNIWTEEKEWTNEDILIYWNVTDENSGLRELILPDGTKVKEEEGNYVAQKNGIYTFVAYDNVGNSIKKEIEINNIDKTAPEVIIETEETENGNIRVKWKMEDKQSGIREMLLPDGTTILEAEGEYEITANGTYTFLAYDNVGNVETKVIEVTKFQTSM